MPKYNAFLIFESDIEIDWEDKMKELNRINLAEALFGIGNPKQLGIQVNIRAESLCQAIRMTENSIKDADLGFNLRFRSVYSC